ncbi:MAG: NAD(P)H-dependent oxidoreductase [Reyranella sp.]|uniref:FMN-dependent NADH-azoreductase n=1 Tax=Reyranella sp. TaxID=1929291 RepID=UPI0025FA4891|nr:NAD(P)H-dependent oxidoreductase [Reyranella sp.]MBR2817972.1 NAD(P)H-dependent oxidoreductase [Reyranella sp.]
MRATALLVEASPRFGRSQSRTAAEKVVDRLKERAPGLRLLRRDLAAEPPPLIDEAFTEAMYVPASRQDERQRQALAYSEAAIAELEQAGALIISTPMNNFTVPAVLKTWIDQVLRLERTFRSTPDGKVGLLADRPTYVIMASGGYITGERARQPDFLTPYLEAVLATLGIKTVQFFHLERLPRDQDLAVMIDEQVQSWLDCHLPSTKNALP